MKQLLQAYNHVTHTFSFEIKVFCRKIVAVGICVGDNNIISNLNFYCVAVATINIVTLIFLLLQHELMVYIKL